MQTDTLAVRVTELDSEYIFGKCVMCGEGGTGGTIKIEC